MVNSTSTASRGWTSYSIRRSSSLPSALKHHVWNLRCHTSKMPSLQRQNHQAERLFAGASKSEVWCRTSKVWYEERKIILQPSDIRPLSAIIHQTSSILLQTSAFVQSTIATLMTCIVLNIWCWKMDKNDNGEIYNIRYTIWVIWWRRMIQFWQLTSKR